jgi:glycosyltransferase involved in cell wall biosynthesis
MKSNPVSVVIRSCNEVDDLTNLLISLREQDYNGSVEIVVVDNASTDGTPEIAKKFGAKVINLPKEEFTYPKSMNLGVVNASHEIVILTVAHALPVNKNWLAVAASYFDDNNVAGIFAHCLPAKKKTLAEILFYYPNYLRDLLSSPRVVKKTEMGILGATNCAIRKSLWEKNHFDEHFELGGEDGQWASWVMGLGYKIIMDVAFTVYHSHYLGFIGLFKQMRYWTKLGKEQKFSQEDLKFRGKIFHNR